MREEEVESLSRHFRSKIEEARKISGDMGSVQSFHATMREVLDYRKWFEFQLECQKTGEKKKELTDRVFFTFSGGEKAMAMYVPLFSAVVAKYAGARPDAPKLILLHPVSGTALARIERAVRNNGSFFIAVSLRSFK